MKNFDADYAAELAKEILSTFYLLNFDFTTPVYITDSDVPVVYSGDKYLPEDFEFDSLVTAATLSVDKITIDMDDAGDRWAAIVLNEDVRNKFVMICQGAWLDRVPRTTIVAPMFYGYVDSWTLSGAKLSLTVCNELVFWNKKTLRQQKASCPWAFWVGGVEPTGCPECGYTGSETTCDKSWDRCNDLGNTINFGGEKYIDAIVNQTIQWGRVKIT